MVRPAQTQNQPLTQTHHLLWRVSLADAQWNAAKQTALWVPVFLTVRENVVSVAVVNGPSMQPTLNPDDGAWGRDRVLLDKWSVRRGNVQHGDVVVLG